MLTFPTQCDLAENLGMNLGFMDGTLTLVNLYTLSHEVLDPKIPLLARFWGVKPRVARFKVSPGFNLIQLPKFKCARNKLKLPYCLKYF